MEYLTTKSKLVPNSAWADRLEVTKKKNRAVVLVGLAIKAGTLLRGACEVCGATEKSRRSPHRL